MDETKKYIEYCTGCGLCHSIRDVELSIDEKGFKCPNLSNKDLSFCRLVCPSGGHLLNSEQIWGKSISTYYAWSEDKYIRNSASSGGVLTSICIYLLKNHIVDGIIQVRQRVGKVYETETVISSQIEDVFNCMGSRYSISSPLFNIKQIVQDDKKYAFVGKPCDVAALRAYMEIDKNLKNSIVFLLSFFCAGMPSNEAQKKLLDALEVNESECTGLRYRGNGWPGYATAICRNGTSKAMTYDESWGKILGRDIRRSCRFCFDGIGLSADIACGDAWYLGDDNKPDFTEKQGRNVVFVRTENGKALFEKCIDERLICGKKHSIDELQYIQRFQFSRRCTMISKIMALKLCGRSYPTYSKKVMLKLAKYATIRQHLSILKGTVERCRNGRI